MRSKVLVITLLLSGTFNIGMSPAFAAEEGMALSYSMQNADTKVTENVSAMQDWAEGEYQEHEGEGLFKKYPDEGQLLQEMAKISKELVAKAEVAKQSGEPDKARAYYYSAESVAQYAAHMPHMLEKRLESEKE